MAAETRHLQKHSATSPWLIVFRVLFTFALAGTVVFIFSNSSQVGSISGLRSRQVTAFINSFFSRVGLSIQLQEYTVRKLGHLAEFMLLGFWLMLTLRIYTRRLLAHVSWPLLFGLGIAVLDEFFQKFVDGRGSDVGDVVIDFMGVLFGLGVALVLMLTVQGIARLARGKRE